MRTITIEIINKKALNLLMDLEQLKLIRLRKESIPESKENPDWIKYKGAMSKQSLEDISMSHL